MSILLGSESGDSDTGTDTMSWISWFCSYMGHEYFTEVQEEFIEDEFNLTGLRQMVPYYNYALEMILDIEEDMDADLSPVPDIQVIENSAERLYGLMHARYIITRNGLQNMSDKYLVGQFGNCPRTLCNNTYVVPCGRSDTPGVDSVKLYCPKCKDIYAPPSTRFNSVDGAYFGTSFPHIFFMSFPGFGDFDRTSEYYIPRIFGFKVSEYSKAGPRMEWLRLGPVDDEESDQAAVNETSENVGSEVEGAEPGNQDGTNDDGDDNEEAGGGDIGNNGNSGMGEEDDDTIDQDPSNNEDDDDLPLARRTDQSDIDPQTQHDSLLLKQQGDGTSVEDADAPEDESMSVRDESAANPTTTDATEPTGGATAAAAITQSSDMSQSPSAPPSPTKEIMDVIRDARLIL